MRGSGGLMLIAAVALALPAAATPVRVVRKRPAPPPPAAAATPPAPVSRSGVLIPGEISLRPTTPAEAEANAVWSLRAGLNVAALQCQYSPFLATVRTYNDFLKHHSAELAAAQATLLGHFKRYDGTKALNSFDQFTTRTYNSYSTLDAQYAFCLAASEAGRGALMLTKGGLGRYALARTPTLRASLVPAVAGAAEMVDLAPVMLPPIE